MKIKELIEILGNFDDETTVAVDGYEGGYMNIKHIELIKVKKDDMYPSCYGEFEDPERDVDNKNPVQFVLY